MDTFQLLVGIHYTGKYNHMTYIATKEPNAAVRNLMLKDTFLFSTVKAANANFLCNNIPTAIYSQ